MNFRYNFDHPRHAHFFPQTREEESWDCSAYYKVYLIFKAHVATYHQLFSFFSSSCAALSVLIDFYFIFQPSSLRWVVNNFSKYKARDAISIFFSGAHDDDSCEKFKQRNAINKIIVLHRNVHVTLIVIFFWCLAIFSSCAISSLLSFFADFNKSQFPHVMCVLTVKDGEIDLDGMRSLPAI